VEIGQDSFNKGVNEHKDISRRPGNVIRRCLAGGLASVMLATGAGVARKAQAEAPNPIVDDTTKIESSSDGIETPEDVLKSQGISDVDEVGVEEQIVAKGVGDLLASADDGTVTNFDAGVEVPKSDGGEVQYGTNVTNESGEAAAKTLEWREQERTPEQMIAENIMNYLNGAPGYTDEEIKKGLIVWSLEKTDDLGLINTRDVQGIFLGYVNRNDGNLLLFLGTKDVDKNRIVTIVRMPFYGIGDKTAPLKFCLIVNSSRVYVGDTSSHSDMLETKDTEKALLALEKQKNRNMVFSLSVDKVTDEEIQRAASFNSETEMIYAGELKETVYCSRSLDALVYKNGVEKLEYKDPGRKLWLLEDSSSLDNAEAFVGAATVGDISNVPFAHYLFTWNY